MALPLFASFYPTAVKWVNSAFNVKELRIIRDNATGAPVGLVSPNANGPEGIWAPVPLTLAQIQAPSAAILADLNATYQYNTAPYTRYRSDGAELIELDETGGTVITRNVVWFSPVVITEANPVTILNGGGLKVIQ